MAEYGDGMSLTEAQVKEQLIELLRREGSPLFADLIKQFDLQLTSKSEPVAAVSYKTMTIILNRGVPPKFYSMLIRHEIMHQMFKHHERVLRETIRILHLENEDLSDKTIDELNTIIYSNAIHNWAGDFEISNRVYSDADKELVRHTIMNGEEIQGLLTENFHPEWKTWTMEEMYRELIKEKMGPEVLEVHGTLESPTIFVDTKGIKYGIQIA